MTLIIGEPVEETEARARWRGTNSATGKPVGVNISHEALADKGEAACLDKACEKYDGSASSVDVTTGDFGDA